MFNGPTLGRSKRVGGQVLEKLGGLRDEKFINMATSYDGALNLKAWCEGNADAKVIGHDERSFAKLLNLSRGMADRSVGMAAALTMNACLARAVLRQASPAKIDGALGLGGAASIISIALNVDCELSFQESDRVLTCKSRAPIANLGQASHCLVPLTNGGLLNWAVVALNAANVSVCPVAEGALPELSLAHLQVDRYDISEAKVSVNLESVDTALVDQQLIGSMLAVYIARRCLQDCVSFAQQRTFGASNLAQQQTIQHRLASLQAEIMISSDWLDEGLRRNGALGLPGVQAAAVCSAVYRATREVVEGTRQLWGGRGFLLDYPVSFAGLQLTGLLPLIGPVEALEARVAGELWGY